MKELSRSAMEPFGSELGRAPGDVPVYSSDYKTADPVLLPTRHDYRHYVDGIYTGYKWQCVEFARRWLLLNKGYVFDDIAMAYEIFRLTSVKTIADQQRLPLHSFENGAHRPPEPGCMLIWNEGGEFDVTGHVAIVTDATESYVRIAEQNLHHQKWVEGADYCRELAVRIDDDGSYWIRCSFSNASILGWVMQTDDPTHSTRIEPPDPRLFTLQLHATGLRPQKKSWLNIANADEAAYVAKNGHRMGSDPARQDQYFTVSRTAMQEVKRASNELHALFMHATEHVMTHEHLLHHFNIPEVLWPRIRQSWANRRNQMITGRFDFCLTEKGLKVYEYNCDSAACYMECGKIQGLWAKYYGCEEGENAGEGLFDHLVNSWRWVAADGLVHLLLDKDPEELYHTLFMREAMTEAGLNTQLVERFDATHWSGSAEVLDENDQPIHWVWKTWAWETALDQLRDEINAEGENPKRPDTPRLMDVLFQPQTMVFEPLWTLVTSNKAMLPILWELFPEHPYLLEAHFELTDSLRSKGYVAKPIAGRCGHNISVVDHQAGVLSETQGLFDHQNTIYQEFFALPEIDGLRVQLCAFTAGCSYAGACARVDSSLIITTDSDLMPLRVVGDKQFLEG